MQPLTIEKIKQKLAAQIDTDGGWEHASDSTLQLGILLSILEEKKRQTKLLEDILRHAEGIRLCMRFH